MVKNFFCFACLPIESLKIRDKRFAELLTERRRSSGMREEVWRDVWKSSRRQRFINLMNGVELMWFA